MTQETIGPGSVVASRFRLEDRLETHSGAGLWRAVDVVLSRNVAVHVVPASDPRSAGVLTAARTSATVSDGRILRVLDALEEGGQVFVVHEWGSGSSLDRLLADDPLEPRRAAWLVREVAEAVTVAHRHGIAHGRLVPENVMVTDAGSVKLIGFVVDAVLHGRSPAEGSTGGRAGGRAEGRSDHESDVRNLGALLYAALVARWPGDDDSVLPDAPRAHGELCRPRQVRAGVPKPLDTLCDRLLDGGSGGAGRSGILPGGRNQAPLESAADVVLALSEYLGDTVPTASPAPLGQGDLDGELTVQLERPGQGRGGAPAVDPQETQAAPPPSWDRERPVTSTVTPPGTGNGEAAGSSVTQRLTAPAPARDPGVGSTVPPTWGPPVSGAGASPTAPAERPGSVWWKLATFVAVAALVVLALVVALDLSGGPVAQPQDPATTPTPGTSAEPAPSVVLAPVAVEDFDPDQQGGGTPEENAELVGRAVDGDPATSWETVTYEAGPVLAPYKDGVGLLLDLGRETEVGRVVLTLAGGPHDVQLLAAPPESGLPARAEGLEVAASGQQVAGRVTLTPEAGLTTRYLVVWLTALPVAEGGYKGRVAEVVVRS